MSDQSARRARAAAQAIDARRRALALALPLGAIALGGGCVSIGGGDTPAPVWYLLEDRGASAAQSRGPSGAAGTAASAGATGTTGRGTAAPIDRVLLIGPVLASSFDEGSMLAYSRQPGTRAHYQFAGWTERPAPRIGVLVERRLAARGSFAAVAQGTAGKLLENLAPMVMGLLGKGASPLTKAGGGAVARLGGDQNLHESQ